MILALHLLELKCRHNFTNNAYTDILDFIEGEDDSEKTEKTTLYLAKGKLNELVDIKLNYVDVCKDSCCAFTGIYINDITCRLCGLEKYTTSNNSNKALKPQKSAIYIPLLDRFRIQYANSERAVKLRYRRQREECNDGYSDSFEGD